MTEARTTTKIVVGAVIVLAVVGVGIAARFTREETPCGAGFTRVGARCCPTASLSNTADVCRDPRPTSCPLPLIVTPLGCDSPDRDVVQVPSTTVTVGPSDWEAEGRVPPRIVSVMAFAIDRVEVTMGRACADNVTVGAPCDGADPARAAFGVPFESAHAYCGRHGGRLPTDDEWLAAAGGARPRRYPWGDTGAVCRRAAWGLVTGPCGETAKGPDTVGAHPDGATPLGIHDLAGNVAEWVDVACPGPGRACPRFVRGGSWKTGLATELRTWVRREASVAADPTIGFRCVYAASP